MERQQDKEGGFEVGKSGDPGDGFGVNRMNGEEQGCEPADPPVEENAPANKKDENHHCGMNHDAEEMEAEGNGAKKLPKDQEAKGHQRAIIIGRSRLTDKRPDGGAEDLRDKMPAFYVRVIENLMPVVINKTVGENVGVANNDNEQQEGNKRSIRPLGDDPVGGRA